MAMDNGRVKNKSGVYESKETTIKQDNIMISTINKFL